MLSLPGIIITVGFFLLVFPEEGNAQSMYNLGTIMVSDDVPSPDGYPPQDSNSCDETQCEGLIWIYYSDAKNLRQWGTINNNQISGDALSTLCHQLGYARHLELSKEPRRGKDIYPVWLTDIDCSRKKSPTNILQCDHSYCERGQPCHNHEKDLAIHCSDKLEPNKYDGGVSLVGPDTKIYGMQTTFGIIQMWLLDEMTQLVQKPITIKSTTDIESFQDSKRDSICIQMGFTRAVTDSVYTVQALLPDETRNITGFNFDYQYRASSWFNINDDTLMECNRVPSVPSQCFRCCYDRSSIPAGGCRNEECDPETNSLVIACTYDPHNEHSYHGSEEVCKLNNNGELPGKKTCDSRVPVTEYSEFNWVVGIFVVYVLVTILAILVVVGARFILFYRRRRQGYIELPHVPNPQPPNREDNEEQPENHED